MSTVCYLKGLNIFVTIKSSCVIAVSGEDKAFRILIVISIVGVLRLLSNSILHIFLSINIKEK